MRKNPISCILALAGLVVFAGCEMPETNKYETSIRQRVLTDKVCEIKPADEAKSAGEFNAVEEAPQKTAGSIPTAGQKINLSQAVRIALANSPMLKISSQDVNISKEKIDVARSAFLPRISGKLAYDVLDDPIELGPVPMLGTLPLFDDELYRAEVTLKWMAYDFGRSQGRYDQARLGNLAVQQEHTRNVQTLIYMVNQAYYNILRAQKAELISKDGLTSARMQLDTAEKLFDQGLVAKDDVLRAKVLVADLQQDLIAARNAIKIAKAAINRIMGINVGLELRFEDYTEKSSIDLGIAKALELAVSNRPELKQVQHGIAIERAGVGIANAEFMPEIYVGSCYCHLEDSADFEDDFFITEIGIQMDFYTGGQRQAELRSANSKLEKSFENAKAVCDLISFEVRQSIFEYENANARLGVAANAVDFAKENLRLMQAKYENSLVSSTDLADAVAQNTNAQQRYYGALYDCRQSIERINFVLGVNEKAYMGNCD